MRIDSPGTQICSHSVMLTHKKRVEVICLTPVKQTEVQNLHPYKLKPHRGGRKSSGILSGEVLNSAGKHKIDFFSSSVFLFSIFLSFFQPFNLTTHLCQCFYPHASIHPNQMPLPFPPLEVSMLSGKKLKQKREQRKRPVYCIKSDASIFLQHCQLSLRTVNPVSLRTINPVIFGVFWFIRS